MSRGYFYADNVSALPLDYIDSIYSVSHTLHSLPIEEKNRCARPHGTYSGSDSGSDELAYEAGSIASVRAWDYSRTRFATAGQTAPRIEEVFGGRGFHGILDELYARQDVLARVLMRAFADMFELPSQTFEDMFASGEGGDMGSIRLLYYPEAKDEEEASNRAAANYGISPHTDFEVFTLMHQNAAGLQFLIPGGTEWVDAPVEPANFVVIVGDVLERLTNGILKATPHRVILSPWSRYSIIRFNALMPDVLIQPLPQFVSATRPALYTPVTMRKHMETTLDNLEKGLGSWEPGLPGRSLSAAYVYEQPC